MQLIKMSNLIFIFIFLYRVYNLRKQHPTNGQLVYQCKYITQAFDQIEAIMALVFCTQWLAHLFFYRLQG